MKDQIFRCRRCGFLVRVIYNMKAKPPKKCFRCGKHGVFEKVEITEEGSENK